MVNTDIKETKRTGNFNGTNVDEYILSQAPFKFEDVRASVNNYFNELKRQDGEREVDDRRRKGLLGKLNTGFPISIMEEWELSIPGVREAVLLQDLVQKLTVPLRDPQVIISAYIDSARYLETELPYRIDIEPVIQAILLKQGDSPP